MTTTIAIFSTYRTISQAIPTPHNQPQYLGACMDPVICNLFPCERYTPPFHPSRCDLLDTLLDSWPDNRVSSGFCRLVHEAKRQRGLVCYFCSFCYFQWKCWGVEGENLGYLLGRQGFYGSRIHRASFLRVSMSFSIVARIRTS